MCALGSDWTIRLLHARWHITGQPAGLGPTALSACLSLYHCLRVQVGPGVLGYGSGGTVVYEGVLDGREVAVKRMLHQFYDLARKEIGALILSDEVGWFISM